MKIAYRPDLDGLRGFAIIIALIYHAEFFIDGKHLLSGGYLGVDIFFVISGYLISSIIIEELRINKNFSYSNFYERRVRRLIPALFTVLIFTSIFSYKFLIPIQYKEDLYSSIFSIFFISNFFFHYSGVAYGADILSIKPLLHTWSLGVEWQFYILFPFFFIYFFKNYFNQVKILIIIAIYISKDKFFTLPSSIYEE